MILKIINDVLDPLRRLEHVRQRPREESRLIAHADVLFLSYPKSGRTWMRSLIGKILQQCYHLPENTDFLEVENLPLLHPGIPKILFHHDDEPFWKTPEELSGSKKIYRRKKVILLVRHPADVLVSGYFEKTKRYVVHGGSKPNFEGTLSEYIYSNRGSTDTLIRYLNIWASESPKFPQLLLLRYEDLSGNTFREAQRIVDFLELTPLVSAEIILAAIECSTFENMRKLEEKDAFGSFRLRAGNLLDPESFKTRKGKTGGYSDYLEKAELDFLARKVNYELSKGYGYSM